MCNAGSPIGICAHGDGIACRERLACPTTAAHDRRRIRLDQPLGAVLIFYREIDMRVGPFEADDSALKRDDAPRSKRVWL